MYEKLSDLTKRVKELKKLLNTEGEAAVKEAFKDFFDKHAEVQGLTWAQYTPYFNDGEECVFGVNDIEVYLDLEADHLDTWTLGKEHQASYAKFKEDLSDLQSRFHHLEEVLQDVFGDHVRVTVTREKIDISDYCHD